MAAEGPRNLRPAGVRLMPTHTYIERRGQLENYFDRTAVEAWKRLTSDAPVGRIRATVRAGRDRMRATLLAWLPADLHGPPHPRRRLRHRRAGGRSGAARRARRRHRPLADAGRAWRASAAPADLGHGHVDFRVGDMLDPALGDFDHVVAMDSLIHYEAADVVRVLSGFAARTRESIVFTFAPRTRAARRDARGRPPVPARRPRAGHRAGARRTALVEPDRERADAAGWMPGRTERIGVGFYTSQALELDPRDERRSASAWRRRGSAWARASCRSPMPRPPSCRSARLLRLSLFQVSVGMAGVLLTGTLNRVMIVELRRAGLARRADGGAAAGLRAVARADRLQLRHAPLGARLAARALHLVRHAAAVRRPRDHAVRAAPAVRRHARPGLDRHRRARRSPSCWSAPACTRRRPPASRWPPTSRRPRRGRAWSPCSTSCCWSAWSSSALVFGVLLRRLHADRA